MVESDDGGRRCLALDIVESRFDLRACWVYTLWEILKYFVGTETVLEKEQVLKLIEKVHFFEHFTAGERETLAKLDCSAYRYQPSDMIIRKGELDQSFFVLLKGVIRITVGRAKEVTLTKLRAGAIFGEISWVSKRPRTSSVYADGDVVALRINLDDVDNFDPALQSKIKDQIIDVLVDRLSKMNEQLANLVR